ncbi:hypothetical protein C1646_732574 [Rhizophagus diaphanus]|nr:hypothetical protein C1646_732574 [Rhizophagus diaphanus] [Rhizophagus sp. MUCL 43196]
MLIAFSALLINGLFTCSHPVYVSLRAISRLTKKPLDVNLLLCSPNFCLILKIFI